MADLLTRQLTMMMFDGVRLAVPLSAAMTIERSVHIQPGVVEGQALGTITARNQSYPVYAFSRRLELLPALPAQRAFCVCLEDDSQAQRLAIACDSVTPLRLDSATVIQPLPTCMQYTGTPLRGFCSLAQQLLLVSTADALAAYIHSKE